MTPTLVTSLPTVDAVLDDYAAALGRDFTAYRNHVHRVVNLCVAVTGHRDDLEKISIAATQGSEGRIVAVLDPYNPKGSTRFVNFITSKPCWKTGAQPPRSQISHVVLDSSWEQPLAQLRDELGLSLVEVDQAVAVDGRMPLDAVLRSAA